MARVSKNTNSMSWWLTTSWARMMNHVDLQTLLMRNPQKSQIKTKQLLKTILMQTEVMAHWKLEKFRLTATLILWLYGQSMTSKRKSKKGDNRSCPRSRLSKSCRGLSPAPRFKISTRLVNWSSLSATWCSLRRFLQTFSSPRWPRSTKLRRKKKRGTRKDAFKQIQKSMLNCRAWYRQRWAEALPTHPHPRAS